MEVVSEKNFMGRWGFTARGGLERLKHAEGVCSTEIRF